MEILYEIIKILLPCLGTFLITYYTCRKNVPLQKYEIAYNRIYYPICCLIRNKEKPETIIEKSEFYIKKYDKYVDRSTVIAYKNLKEALKYGSAKKEQTNFENNIYKIDSTLRKSLGYLEINLLSRYEYFTSIEKSVMRIGVETIILCFIPLIAIFIPSLYTLMATLLIVILAIFVLEILALGVKILVLKIKNYFYRKKLEKKSLLS